MPSYPASAAAAMYSSGGACISVVGAKMIGFKPASIPGCLDSPRYYTARGSLEQLACFLGSAATPRLCTI
jgi:hypothetical protein